MKYTLKDLRNDLPDDDACLEWLINYRFPDGVTCDTCNQIRKHHKVSGRKCYACDHCGTHLYPMVGTIFENSHVPLTDWFHAIFMMSSNKAGTSAMQIQRELGVAYRTAWRMMHQIRKMMNPPEEKLTGEVEMDETFIHPNPYKNTRAMKRIGSDSRRTGWVVFGMVQRGGHVKVFHVRSTGVRVLGPLIENNITSGSVIHTDGFQTYRSLSKLGYDHRTTDHGTGQFYTSDSHTQNIENVWSHFKRGIKGVYRHIGRKYIQLYAREYAWRYSNRKATSLFWVLMDRVSQPAPIA